MPNAIHPASNGASRPNHLDRSVPTPLAVTRRFGWRLISQLLMLMWIYPCSQAAPEGLLFAQPSPTESQTPAPQRPPPTAPGVIRVPQAGSQGLQAQPRPQPQSPPKPASQRASSPAPEKPAQETWVNIVIERPGGGIVRNRFSDFGERMAAEVRLRIAKQELDTPEPVLTTKSVSALRSTTAPFACLPLDLSDLPTLSPNEKQSMEEYLRRGGFVWIIAHSPSEDYTPDFIPRGESFFEHILRRVLPASVVTPDNVKRAGFRPVIPPSVIDPSMSEELTELITARLKQVDILSLEGRPVAIVSQTFPTPEVKDIYQRRPPTTPPLNPQPPANPKPSQRKDPHSGKMFSIKHKAINLYVNILLH